MTKKSSSINHYVAPVSGVAAVALASVTWPLVETGAMGSAAVVFFASLVPGLAVYSLVERLIGRNRPGYHLSNIHKVEALNKHAIFSVTDANFKIIEVNEKLLEFSGYKREDLIGKSPGAFYEPNDQDLLDEIQARLKAGQSWHGEARFVTASGRPAWTHATIIPRFSRSGKLIGSVAVRTDITSTKLAAADRYSASVLQFLGDEVFIIDAETFQFTYLNEAAKTLTGWSVDDSRKLQVSDVWPDFDADRFRRYVHPLLTGERRQLGRQVVFQGRHSELTTQMIRGVDYRARFVIMLRDVSKRVEAEQKKQDIVSTVSHELRTPLTSIKGAIGLILSGTAGETSQRVKDMLGIAHRNADRLVLIINDILDLDKIAAGAMEFELGPVDLAELAVEAILANQPFAARFDVTVNFRRPETGAFAMVDANRVIQVLTNLLSNAAKFSRPGGTIDVEIRNCDGKWRTIVRDHGVGIPAADQNKIFGKFSQAGFGGRAAVGSTGLGLSIVKAIVENQDGKVSFESVEGVGTTFMVDFPILETSSPINSSALEQATK